MDCYWKGSPLTLKNAAGCYQHALKEHAGSKFEREVEWWLKEDILILWKEEVESAMLPLMAVVQLTQHKIKPDSISES